MTKAQKLLKIFESNAPEFAYGVLTGKETSIRGRKDHSKKDVEGISIDNDIPTDAMKKLNTLDGIEARASCQGDDELPTYFIFRPNDQDKGSIEKLVSTINSKLDSGKCGYDVGKGGKYRVVIVNNASISNYQGWWKSLPNIILSSIKSIS